MLLSDAWLLLPKVARTFPPLVVLVLALRVWVSLLELVAVVPVLERYLSGSRTRLTNLINI